MSHPSQAARPGRRSPTSWGQVAARARLAPVRAELDLMRALRLEQEQKLAGANDADRAAAPSPRRTSALLSAIRASLHDIDAALDRIERGTYGTCVACAEQIAASRLIALPETGMCGRCAKRTPPAGAPC